MVFWSFLVVTIFNYTTIALKLDGLIRIFEAIWPALSDGTKMCTEYSSGIPDTTMVVNIWPGWSTYPP